MRKANVFVLGLDEDNAKILRSLPQQIPINLHGLMRTSDLLDMDTLDLPARISEAEQTLRDFDGSVDAVIGYWDFPVTSIVAMMCRRFGLSGPRLEAVVRAEHKYWSRLTQAAVIDDLPGFALVPLSEDDPVVPDAVSFPMWLKPVKGFSSRLAFRVENEQQFRRAVSKIRQDIDALSEPFELVLAEVDLLAEIAEAGSHACLAEEAATGRQFTVEGYCFADVPHVYGIVESVLYPGRANFARYQYPVDVPGQVYDRMVTSTEAVLREFELGNSTFNVEYFWDEGDDRLRLLEINPRHSQSHAELFAAVDGVANHQAMLELGLGQEPQMPHRDGDYPMAAKFFLRVFDHDGVVSAAPSSDDIARVKQMIPGVVAIKSVISPGMQLSELPNQDPYSYSLADIVIGGEDTEQLLARYRATVDALEFTVDQTPDGSTGA